MPQTGLAGSRAGHPVAEERRAVAEERGAGTDRSRAPSVAAAAGSSAAAGAGVPGRRTVEIRGRGAERYSGRYADGSRRRPERRHEREGFRPDRAALWAFLLGLTLILVAVTSAHAAVL
jgi:hypothetical protein